MNSRGFSFLGVLFLVVLLAVAGSIVVASMTSGLSNDDLSQTVKKMDRVLDAIAKYKADNGANPPTLSYLFSDVGSVGCTANTATSAMTGWCGPYLDQIWSQNTNDYITDGWGTAFQYNNAGFLYSCGPNKTFETGAGDDLTRTF